jgi:glycosyltransferase involved in cell wall biosynthesis
VNKKSDPLISFVIPAYQEQSNLPETIARIRSQVDLIDAAYEFVLIDDGSQDSTWAVIEELFNVAQDIKARRFSRNFGKEAAIFAGLEMAHGDAVIVIDADLQHPVEVIPDMIQIWRTTSAEVVDAKRKERGREPFWRRIGAWIFYSLLRIFSGYDLMGLTDYKLLDRKVVDAFLDLEERSRFFRGMVPWLGFKHVEVTFVTSERKTGKSRWSFWKLISLMVTAITSFSTRPLQIITLLGGLFLIFSVFLGGLVIYQISTDQAVEGFATVILLQLIIGSIIMFGLGLIGTYLAKVFEEVKQRPFYVIKDTLKKD